MGALPIPTFTPAEYLEYDRRSNDKFEFLDGVIIAMAGGSPRHGVLAGRVAMQLAGAIDSSNCQPITSDVRVLLDRKRAFAYPDYGVVCGKIEYDAVAWDAITNPSLIVEVLSPSTAMYDTGAKASLYHAIPSLNDLLLVAQEPVWIEHHYRVSASSWRIDLIVNPGASIHIQSLNAHISVDAIYAGTADIPAHSPQT